MKLSIFTQHIWDMATDRGWTRDQAMEQAAGLGITGVEITYGEFQKILPADYKAALDRHGLKTVCIHNSMPLCSGDELVFQGALADGRTLIDTAALMGAPNVLIVASDGSDIANEEDRERAKSRMICGLRELAAYGAAQRCLCHSGELFCPSLSLFLRGRPGEHLPSCPRPGVYFRRWQFYLCGRECSGCL